MFTETVIALDLEGTLISNAVSQFPRPGLYSFLEFCDSAFDSVYLYTAVRDELCGPILQTLVAENLAPGWMSAIPFVQWDRKFKDIANIPHASVQECLIVDDNPDYILADQRSQWIPIEKYESPYPDTDRELLRVQRALAERITGR